VTSSLRPAGSTRRWRRLRVLVLERDGFRCQLHVDAAGRHVEDDDPAAERRCLEYAEHVDHIVERRHGGDDRPSNLRAACRAGNLGRRRADDQTTPGRSSGRPAVTRESPRRWSW
jgi:5-methylcytosine-specific restriction endonuclease McrA